LIKVDNSLFIQVAIFVSFAIAMDRILFRPFVAFLEERSRRIFGAKEEADRLKAEAQAIAEVYEKEVLKGKEEALREALNLREEAKRERDVLLSSKREEAQQYVLQAKKRLKEEAEKAMGELEAVVEKFAKSLGEQVLGRPLG